MKKAQRPRKYGIEQFYAIRLISGFSISPNGKTIAYITNTNGFMNVWSIPIEGGWTSQITIEQNGVKVLDYSSKNNEIFYQTDMNGDENLQIYLIDDKGGDVTYLTPEHKGSQVYFLDSNKKGTKIIYTSNKRDKRFFDTYILHLDNLKEECVYQSENIYTEVPAAWSKNERYIILNTFYNNSNSDLLIYDTRYKSKINFTAHEGFMVNSHPYITKDNKRIYFLSDYKSEFAGIAYYDLKKEKNNWLIQEKWDVTSYKLDRSEKNILYSVNENGRSGLFIYNIRSGKKKKVKLPKGNVIDFRFTPDEKKIVVLLDSSDNPADLYVYDLRKKKINQITFSMIGGISRKSFVKAKKIEYKSFDGLKISGLMFIPSWMKKDGTNPAILWPHGGPEFQEKDMYRQYFQILCNRGYIVIAPNFRGSTGYGKSFQKLIYKDWGGNEFKDVLGAYDYLLNTGYVDKKRICVLGGSFGGYMTLTCVTRAPDLWKCAVDIFGPSNLVTFADSVPEHWKPAVYQLVGDPVKDKDYFYERSPINFVDNIKCPMLIVQGANDPRVVQKESDQMVNVMKKKNKKVEYIVLPDEGHGFSKVSNQIMVWKKIDEFLENNL